MSIIKVPTPDGEQLFRVAAPTVSMGEITAQCYHIFYDLTENLIEDIFAEITNGNGAMNRMSAGCQYKHPFTFILMSLRLQAHALSVKSCGSIAGF